MDKDKRAAFSARRLMGRWRGSVGVALAAGALSVISSASQVVRQSRGRPDTSRPFRPTDVDCLWAWGTAGVDAANLTLVDGPRGSLIEHMEDSSGKANHFFNYWTKRPGHRVGLDLLLGDGYEYSTALPLIGIDEFAPGKEHYSNVYYQSSGLQADGAFYLAAVCGNTRTTGERGLFGTDARNSVHVDQLRNSVSLCVDGVCIPVVDFGECPRGIILLEIFRDDGDRITCLGNGRDITVPGANLGGLFDVIGVGLGAGNNSQWDDWLMEVLMFDDLPTAEQRLLIRRYLRRKWGLW